MVLFMEGTRFNAGLACKVGYWCNGKNRNFLLFTRIASFVFVPIKPNKIYNTSSPMHIFQIPIADYED